MLIRRAASQTTTLFRHHFCRRSLSTAALLQENHLSSYIPEFTNLEGYPRPDPKNAETIRAIPRSDSGSKIAAKERKAGRVPSILFEAEDGEHGGNKRLISVQNNQIRKLVNNMGRTFFLSRLFDLEVYPEFGSEEIIEKVRVLPRSLHLDGPTDSVLNVTFMRAPSSAWIKVEVPIMFIGNEVCPGIKKGSTLTIIRRTIKFHCPADIIPPYIEVDLSELDVDQMITAGDLKVHPALKLLCLPDQAIVKIMSARGAPEHVKSK